MNKQKLTFGVLTLALVGLILSVILLKQHLYHLASGFDEQSFCNVNQTINCDAVDASPYSKIFGLPVSGFSLFYYGLMCLLAILALISRQNKSLAFGFLLSIPALVITLIMAYLSFVKLKVLCLLCVGLYLVNIGLILLIPWALGLTPNQLASYFEDYFLSVLGKNPALKTSFIFYTLVTLITFAVGAAILHHQVGEAHAEAYQKAQLAKQKLKNPNEDPPLTTQDIVKLHRNQAPVQLDTSNLPVKGNKASKVSLVEFSDFECPFCKKASLFLEPILKEYGDKIAFYFAHYPLDKSCNADIKRDLHKMACDAAKATYCAGEQDKFWEFHDILFQNQPKFSQTELETYAKNTGLKLDNFNTCLKSDKAHNKIQEDLNLGRKAGIGGTPSLFLNGRPVKGWNNPELFKAILDEEIKNSQP